VKEKEREGGRWFGHGPVWEYLITNIKNTTERLCHIPTVQLQPGPDSPVINTSYRVAPECTYSTTHTHTKSMHLDTQLPIHVLYIWRNYVEMLGHFLQHIHPRLNA